MQGKTFLPKMVVTVTVLHNESAAALLFYGRGSPPASGTKIPNLSRPPSDEGQEYCTVSELYTVPVQPCNRSFYHQKNCFLDN